MGQRKDYNQRPSEYLNADAASRISAIRSDLNRKDNTNRQEQQGSPEKAIEKLIPCPRQIDGTPFIEYSPGYLIHQDDFEDYVSGARQLPTDERQQVDAEQKKNDWMLLVGGREGLPWTLEGWHFKAVIGTINDDSRFVHHP